MQSLIKYYTIDKKNLAYIKFILESYDNLAFISTIDANKGIVKITIPKDLEDEFTELLNALKKEISILEIKQESL